MLEFSDFKLHFKYFKKKFDLLLVVYIFFLFLIPNDLLELTSVASFQKSDTMYYDAKIIYVSILYFPILIFGIKRIFKHKISFYILLLLMGLAIKDIIVFFSGDYHYFQFDLYYVYMVALCELSIIIDVYNNLEATDYFMKVFLLIHLITLLISVVTGMGVGTNGLEKRYHSSGIGSGETAYLLALLACYFFYVNKDKWHYLYFMTCIIGIIATGTRKEVLYILIIICISFVVNISIKHKLFNFRRIKKHYFLLFLFFSLIFLFLVIFNSSLLTRFDIERYVDVFTGLHKNGIGSLLQDDSAQGRLDSIIAGFNVLKQSPIFGVTFSFFDVQYYMQVFNYPTFPHSTLLFYACCMGLPICFIILIWLIKMFIRLIRNKINYVYVILYFFIHNIVSGGALINEKIIFFNLFIIYLINLYLKDHMKEQNYLLKKNLD